MFMLHEVGCWEDHILHKQKQCKQPRPTVTGIPHPWECFLIENESSLLIARLHTLTAAT